MTRRSVPQSTGAPLPSTVNHGTAISSSSTSVDDKHLAAVQRIQLLQPPGVRTSQRDPIAGPSKFDASAATAALTLSSPLTGIDYCRLDTTVTDLYCSLPDIGTLFDELDSNGSCCVDSLQSPRTNNYSSLPSSLLLDFHPLKQPQHQQPSALSTAAATFGFPDEWFVFEGKCENDRHQQQHRTQHRQLVDDVVATDDVQVELGDAAEVLMLSPAARTTSLEFDVGERWEDEMTMTGSSGDGGSATAGGLSSASSLSSSPLMADNIDLTTIEPSISDWANTVSSPDSDESSAEYVCAYFDGDGTSPTWQLVSVVDALQSSTHPPTHHLHHHLYTSSSTAATRLGIQTIASSSNSSHRRDGTLSMLMPVTYMEIGSDCNNNSYKWEGMCVEGDFNSRQLGQVPSSSTADRQPATNCPFTLSAVGSQNAAVRTPSGDSNVGKSSKSTSSVSKPRNRKGCSGKPRRSICLWQFLRELLHVPQLYQSSIRWIDRNGGIFKIEDSVRVAKLWGECKNRPAMNYDKLSRSIRQYYKQGIIRKTSKSRRLVFQFCPQYL